MTKNHPISTNPTKPVDVPSLPDRSDLSKLYFVPKKPSVTINQNAHILDDERLPTTIRGYALKVGFLLTIPFITAIIPATLFLSVVSAATLFSAIPLIIVWGVSAVLVFRKIITLLNRVNIPPVMFLCLQISCLMLVVPSIYYISEHTIALLWLRLAIISLLLISASITFTWMFMQLTLNNTLSNKRRGWFVGSIVAICLVSISIYFIANLR